MRCSSKLLSLGCQLAATFLTLVPPSASAEPVRPERSFKVGSRIIVGVSKEVCELSGTWSDGRRFRYQAWDRCQDLSVRALTPEQLAEIIRSRRQANASLAPEVSEFIEITNEFSRMVIYSDASGNIVEIAAGD